MKYLIAVLVFLIVIYVLSLVKTYLDNRTEANRKPNGR